MGRDGHRQAPGGTLRAPTLQLHLLVFVWSFTAILGAVISMEAPALVAWRTLIASAAYFLWVRLRRPERLRVPPALAPRLIGIGAILGAHWVCFFAAIALSNVSVGLAGFASTSLFTAVVEPLFERRAPRWGELALGGLVLVGLLLIAGTETVHLAGLLVGLMGALLAAVYSVLNRHVVLAGVPTTTILVYGMPGACLMAVLAMAVVPAFRFEVPARTDWLPLLILALGCTFLAYLWYTNLMRYLTAYASSLALNFEPVYGILLAALFFQEHKSLHPTFYLGTLAIIAANVLHGFLQGREARPVPPGSRGGSRD